MTFRPILAALLVATSALAYDSVEELIKDHRSKETEALRAYIAANPDADDIREARDLLIANLIDADDTAAATALLREQYNATEKPTGEDGMREIFVGTIMPLVEIYRESGNKTEGLAFVEQVRKDFASHPMAEELAPMLDNMAGGFNTPGVGEAMDFTFTTLAGDKLSLADLKGKVVLVDFWATWCGPCVKEIPHLKEAYEAYKDKGFEIVGISLDEDREQLDAFIEQQGVTWLIQFDGTGWENELAQKYGIQGIPSTFLLDQEGKVAAKDLRGDDLSKEVAKLLGL